MVELLSLFCCCCPCCCPPFPGCWPSSCLILLARWEWMCLVRWSLRLKPLPHSLHRCTLSVRWIIECLCRCSCAQNRWLVVIFHCLNNGQVMKTHDSFESFTTNRTRMWTFGHVWWPVSVEVFFTFKSCATIVTDKRSFRSVYRQVCLNRLAIVEDGVALWTSVKRRSIQGCWKGWLQTCAPSSGCGQPRDRISSLFLLFGFLWGLRVMTTVDMTTASTGEHCLPEFVVVVALVSVLKGSCHSSCLAAAVAVPRFDW